jgi:leucyl-tRNA synthetase
LQPIGWDAFGLPAENAAIDRGVSPEEWTLGNMGNLKMQLQSLSIDFDWDREISTCDPSYYKWTQWLFLELHKAGLAYRAEALVNWDPVDQTVLANEQVDASGRSWRSGAVVEQVPLKQWFFRITSFAPVRILLYKKKLLENLNKLNWPQKVKEMQKNWIGLYEGWEIYFDSVTFTKQPRFGNVLNSNGCLPVFTKRPECILGVTFIGVSSFLAGHPN